MNFHPIVTQELRMVNLEAGRNYWVSYASGKPKRCRFIRVTKTGYNLLEENTSNCVLPKLIYPVKKNGFPTSKFVIPWTWIIKDIKNEV